MARRSDRVALLETERELQLARAEAAALHKTIDALTASNKSLQSGLEAMQAAFTDQKIAFEKTLAELQALQRRLFRKKSEKLPPPAKALAERSAEPKSAADAQTKRRDRAEKRGEVEVRQEKITVAEERRSCPHCGREHLKTVGAGRVVSVLDYVPGTFVRTEYSLETLACPCGEYIVTAESPVRPFEQGKYGPHFIAYVIVSKLLDALPHHRLEKIFARSGIPMPRSTMTDLLHRAADILAPLVIRIFELIAAGEVVQADETSIKVQHREKLAFFWTFIHESLIGYRFSPDRSGETPKSVLGESNGILVVDGYTGYNGVTTPTGRIRAGCLAHFRRKLFEVREQVPEANVGLELILDVYAIEHDAKERGIYGSPEHLALRQERAAPVMAKIKIWLEEQLTLHPPRSSMGTAVKYALKSWAALTVFLTDPRVPVDNNKSESALRAVALGRKNFLFVGNDVAGQNIAGLLSLVATCVANDVNPLEYLADILVRVHSHPASQLDELLPHRWKLTRSAA